MSNQIIEHLKKTQSEFDAKDPLLQRGIEKDWVCVVHPAIEYKLRQKAVELYGDTPHMIMFGIDRMTGRKTYVEPSAPMKLEYMPLETYFVKYGKDILARAEIKRTILEANKDIQNDE